MKKIALLLLTVLLLTSCSTGPTETSNLKQTPTPSPTPITSTVDIELIKAQTERIDSYYNQGMYYEALTELNQLEASDNRSVWDQNTINAKRTSIETAAANVNTIYKKFGLIKNYLNQKLYYEARDELTWLETSFSLPPTESAKWEEYNLDVQAGIREYEQLVAEAEQKRQEEAARQASEANKRVKDAEKAKSNASQKNSYTVYITRTGSKYHRAGCRYLRQSQIAIDRNAAINQGYDACSVCNP